MFMSGCYVALSFGVAFGAVLCEIAVDVYGGVGLFFDVLLFKCTGWYV